MTVALNDCFCRFFGFHRWEIVRFPRNSFDYPSLSKIFLRFLRNLYDYPSLTEIFHSRFVKFQRRLPTIALVIQRCGSYLTFTVEKLSFPCTDTYLQIIGFYLSFFLIFVVFL